MPKKKRSNAQNFSEEELAKFMYEVNDIVLAYHSEYLYEAKVLERRINKRKANSPPEYKIHYQGWNKRHDEWVGNDRVLPKNPSNMMIKQELDVQMKQELEREKAITQPGISKKRKSKADDAPSQKRRKLNSNSSNSSNTGGNAENEKSPDSSHKSRSTSRASDGGDGDRGRPRQRKTRHHERGKKGKKRDESESSSDSGESSSGDDSDDKQSHSFTNSKSVSRSQTNSSNESNSDDSDASDKESDDNSSSKKRRKKGKKRKTRGKKSKSKKKSGKSRDKSKHKHSSSNKDKDKDSNKNGNSSNNNGTNGNAHTQGVSTSTTTMSSGSINMTMNNMMHVTVTPGSMGTVPVVGVGPQPPPPHPGHVGGAQMGHTAHVPPPPQPQNMFSQSNGPSMGMANNGAHYGYNGSVNGMNNMAPPPMMNGHPGMMQQPMPPQNMHMNPNMNMNHQYGAPNGTNGSNMNTNASINNNNNNNINNSNHSGGNGNGSNKHSSGQSNKLNITLPKAIKKKLIFDWEQITKDSKLMRLPRESGERVIDILKDYEDHANSFTTQNGPPSNDNNTQKDVIAEIVRGLRDYFDQALEVTLLYKFERPQLSDLTQHQKDLAMSQIYGVEHLCRLFVKLPQLLAPDELDSETRRVLTDKIDDIIKFLLQNEHKYFTKSYIDADDNYKQRVANLEAQMNNRPPAHRMNT